MLSFSSSELGGANGALFTAIEKTTISTKINIYFWRQRRFKLQIELCSTRGSVLLHVPSTDLFDTKNQKHREFRIPRSGFSPKFAR